MKGALSRWLTENLHEQHTMPMARVSRPTPLPSQNQELNPAGALALTTKPHVSIFKPGIIDSNWQRQAKCARLQKEQVLIPSL